MKDMIIRLWLLALVAGATFPVSAHETKTGWAYDAICCNGNAVNGDCHHIPRESVKAVKNGWQVTLYPGDHPLVTKPHTYFKAYDKTRRSQDGDFHACLWPNETELQCLYAPDMGM